MNEHSPGKDGPAAAPSRRSWRIQPWHWLAGGAAIVGLASLAIPASMAFLGFRSSQDPTGVVLIDDEPLLPPVPSLANLRDVKTEAIKTVDRMIEDFPQSAHAYSVKGQVHSAFGSSDAAMKSWRTCVELDPSFARPYTLISSKLMDEGSYHEAAEWLREALALDSTATAVASQLADALMHGGKMEEARELLEEQLRAGSASAGTHFLLGQIALQLREYESSRRHLTKVVSMNPKDTYACYGLARAYGELGDQEEAAKWRRKFQTLKAEEMKRGVDKYQRRQDRSQVRGTLAFAYREVGKVYHLNGEATQAESHWLTAAALEPGDTESRYALMLIYRKLNDRVRLLKVLRQLSEIDPSNSDHWLELGRVQQALQQFESAEVSLTRSCELAPGRSEGYNSLALVHVQADWDTQQAMVFARKAVQLNPSAENYFTLGVACQAEGDSRSAAVATRRAVELEPSNSTYRAAYETLRYSF